jgi:molybdopterin molybdotransferase
MKSIQTIAAQLQGYDPSALSAQAVEQFLSQLGEPVTQTETLPLLDCIGRVLAQDVVSSIDVPAQDNSAMDGFAFNADELDHHGSQALSLEIIGTVLAGAGWGGVVERGQAVKIMTGALMPSQADTVVPQEFTHLEANSTTRFWFDKTIVKRGDNRRLKGEDIAQGSIALAKGTQLTAPALGLIASVGLAQVTVFRRLKVAYFSTGNEVISPGEIFRDGALYDSNRFTVLSYLKQLGCEPIDMGKVGDDPRALEQAFVSAANIADVIITSGGVSVGEADFTKAMMKQLGDVAFWRVAMRPGRPMAVGTIGQSVLFGLPGNPVAVVVTFLAFVRQALLRLMGATPIAPVLLQAITLAPIRKRPGRTEYQRGHVSLNAAGQLVVRNAGNQGSGVLSSVVNANGLIVLEHERGNIHEGEVVSVLMLN